MERFKEKIQMFPQLSCLIFSQVHWLKDENFKGNSAVGVFVFREPNGIEA